MKKLLLNALRTLLLVLFVQQVVVRLVRKIRPFPMPAVAARLVLDSPLRRLVENPDLLLDRAGLRPGMRVLELGPGPGFYTVAAARRVGPRGRLDAVDIESRLIAQVQKKVNRLSLQNVFPQVGNAYHLPFDDGTFDLAYLVSVLAEIPDRPRALRELRRVLKPGGTLSVSETLFDPDYPLAGTVQRWAEAAGFALAERQGNLLHYTLNFRPSAT